MKLITAIVRTTSIEAITKSLETAGIRGMTIMEIKGIGEQVTLFRPYSIHNRIDVYIPDEKADAVTKIILDHASTGMAGDGFLAVHPVNCVVKLRTGVQVECLL